MQLHSWRASQSPGGASHFSTWTSRGWIGMKLDFIHKIVLNCPNHQVFEVCLGLCHPRSLLCHSRSKVCYKSSNSACIIILTNVACCGVEDDYDTEDADADKEAELLIKPNQIKSNQWDCVDKWEVAMCEGCFEEETIPTDRSQTLSHKSLPSSLTSSLEYTLWHIHIRHRHTHTRHIQHTRNWHRHQQTQIISFISSVTECDFF